MHNVNIPPASELPSTRQLLRSTAIAAATAAVLLVTTVLPAEYGIDPTGVGGVLGLTAMGEIKTQLQEEAEANRLRDQSAAPNALQQRSSLDTVGEVLANLFISPAVAQMLPAQGAVLVAQADRSDTTTLTLKPGEGAEVKAVVAEGATVTYRWTVAGGVVNHDTHGEPGNGQGQTHSYKKGRGVSGDEGSFRAVFDGTHGWFWRNRDSAPVTITLTTSGAYTDLKRKL